MDEKSRERSGKSDSGGIFDEYGKKDAGNGEPAKKPFSFWRVGVVLILLLVIAFVVFFKNAQQPDLSGSSESVGSEVSSPSAKKDFSSDTALATVEGREITLQELEAALNKLPSQYRGEYERQKHEFLEQLIVRQLLVEEARKRNVDKTQAYLEALGKKNYAEDEKDNLLVNLLIDEHILKNVDVSDEDVREFYEEYEDQLPGSPTFEKAKDMILPSVMQQKQYEALEDFIAGLKSKSAVSRNDEWVEAQKALLADNPLDKALASGKPVLADFGRGTCIPCKMMKPILDGLAEELKGKVHVLILDTGDYGYLARRVNIRVIPTQIFYDASAGELFRHEGFMSKEDILAKFDELGIPAE